MTFSWWTFLFEVLNFLVLAYVLHRLLYRPLREAIDARRAADALARQEAEKAGRDATDLRLRLEEEHAGLERERQELLRTTREQAEADRRRILAETEQTARYRQEELRTALQRDRDEALRSLRGEVLSQAVELSERLLREAVGEGLQNQLALRLAEELDKIAPEKRGEVVREWADADGAVLETASPLLNGAAQPIRAAVERLLGREVTLAVQTRPDLVGGVRLRLGGHVWDASVTGQMEEIRAGGQRSGIGGKNSEVTTQ